MLYIAAEHVEFKPQFKEYKDTGKNGQEKEAEGAKDRISCIGRCPNCRMGGSDGKRTVRMKRGGQNGQ
jgi:hypothetical protein